MSSWISLNASRARLLAGAWSMFDSRSLSTSLSTPGNLAGGTIASLLSKLLPRKQVNTLARVACKTSFWFQGSAHTPENSGGPNGDRMLGQLPLICRELMAPAQIFQVSMPCGAPKCICLCQILTSNEKIRIKYCEKEIQKGIWSRNCYALRIRFFFILLSFNPSMLNWLLRVEVEHVVSYGCHWLALDFQPI